MGQGDLYLSATPLISDIKPQFYWSCFGILRQQLVALDDVTGHSESCAQHHLRPFPETASFRHLKEVGVDSLPFRPMRTWYCHKVDGETREVVGR